ncbi:hypothetical protein TrST_g971 [Triparma strigata]|nr:hypothetical protein TrST_g971 [Triparma strigata]
MVFGPIAILTACQLWVTGIYHKSPTAWEWSVVVIGVSCIFASATCTFMDRAPRRSKILAVFTCLCTRMMVKIMISARHSLHMLSDQKKAMHLRKIVFLGGVAAMIPILFLTLESIGCIFEVDDLLSIRRPANPTRLNRFDDEIWSRCSAVFVPNYTMGCHIALLQAAVVFYAPFAEWTFHDLVKFKLEKRVQIQITLVSFATVTSLFTFGIKEEDGGMVPPKALQMSNLIFLFWVWIGFLQASSLFTRANMVAWTIPSTTPTKCRDRLIIKAKKLHNKWNSLLFYLIDSVYRLMDCSPISLSTTEDFELAPIYRIYIGFFCVANFVLHLMFPVLKEPKLVWYACCAVPAFMTSEAVYFCAAPRRPGFPLRESIIFLLFPASFFVTAIGHYVTDYWTEKVSQNLLISAGSLLFFPLALKLRYELGNLDDSLLTEHIHNGVFAGMANFMGMTFFLAEGFGCLLGRSTIDEIDANCGGIVFPAFGCAANIGAMLIYKLGFGIFDKAILNSNTTTADVMKFNLSLREKSQMALKLLAAVLCLFLFGNATEGPVTTTLNFMVLTIAMSWIACFVSQAFSIISFVAKARLREKLEKEEIAFESGNRQSLADLEHNENGGNENNADSKLPFRRYLREAVSLIQEQLSQTRQLTSGCCGKCLCLTQDTEPDEPPPPQPPKKKGRRESAVDSLFRTTFSAADGDSSPPTVLVPTRLSRQEKSSNPMAAKKHGLQVVKRKTNSKSPTALETLHSSGDSEDRIHLTQVVSVSRYIRALLFIPVVVLSALWLCMVFIGEHDVNQNFGWLAYQWNGYAISSTIVIWTSKVRKPYMLLETVTFCYWPLMLICIDIERNGEFGKDWLLIPRLLVLFCSWLLAKTIRSALANLDDKVLSAHLQKVVWGGGLSALTPIAYVSMKGSTCVLTNWNSKDLDQDCGGVVAPLLGVAFHLTAFFGYGVCFGPFMKFDTKDLLELKVSWVIKLHVMFIALASIIAIFLFGQQREDSGVGNFVWLLSDTVQYGWFMVVVTGVWEFLVKQHCVCGKRAGSEEEDDDDNDIELPAVVVRDTETDDDLVEGDGNKILSGEGIFMSPGMY